MPAKKTKYGRTIKSGHKDPNFHYPNPFEKKKGGVFQVRFLFQKGDVVPVFHQDDLKVQQTISNIVNYLSPSKTKASITSNGSPCRRTITPRHRMFKEIGGVTAKNGNQKTQVKFYQVPGNAEGRLKKYPPVINKSASEVLATITPPKNDYKSVQRVVTKSAIENACEEPRLPPKRLFHDTSANDYVHAQDPGQVLKAKYQISHMDQVRAGGTDSRESTTITTEGFNIRRCVLVEGPATSIIRSNQNKINKLHYSARAELQKDKNGNPTHIGNNEVCFWRSPKKTRSLKVEQDSQNSEFPTEALSEMAQCIYNKTF